MDLEIRHLGPGDDDAVGAAAALFDHPPKPDATRRFLEQGTHHLLVAYDTSGEPIGFVTGVETTHPDKGTEMFLYELGVAAPARRQGVGSALAGALAALARQRGCYGMWVGTQEDNVAAQRTYERAGAEATPAQVILEWDLTP
jgi:aminoglycoside 3-N-acetyltransferase I